MDSIESIVCLPSIRSVMGTKPIRLDPRTILSYFVTRDTIKSQILNQLMVKESWVFLRYMVTP